MEASRKNKGLLPFIEDLILIPENFGNIKTNLSAQRYLKQIESTKSDEILFEEIFEIEKKWGMEMMKRREFSRSRSRNKIEKQAPSYLDTIEKEQAFYNTMAKENVVEVMNWLADYKSTKKQE